MVRLLTAEDFALWKSLRLEALAAHPPAYNGSFEEESALRDAQWQERLKQSSVFVYTLEDTPVGMAGYYTDSWKKKRHQGIVFTIYVQSACRGKGIMDWLIQALCYHARAAGVEQLHLSVGAYNTSAIHCYERNGFCIYGTEPRAIKLNGEYIDEHLMVKYI